MNFALYDGVDRYGGIAENDPALVTLRASHEVVDLHTVDTAVNGEFAYPMLARGRLVGALVLGPKRSGESYAPDESSAIAQVAHGVGVALDLLGARDAKSNGVLRELGTDIQWLESYVTDDKIFCVYLASHEGMIRKHAEMSGFPATKITEVRKMIDPTTEKAE